MTIGRNIGAVAAGVVAAGMVIAVVEMLIHAVTEGDAMFFAVALGYGLGAMTGTWLALKISPARTVGVVVTALLAALAVSNLFIIDHPIWFVPLAAFLLAIGWWFGDRLGTFSRGTVDG